MDALYRNALHPTQLKNGLSALDSGLHPGGGIEALLARLQDPLLFVAKPHAGMIALAPDDGGRDRRHLIDDKPEQGLPVRHAFQRNPGAAARNIHDGARNARAVASEFRAPIRAHAAVGRCRRAGGAAKRSDIAAEFGIHGPLSVAGLVERKKQHATGTEQSVLNSLDKILDERIRVVRNRFAIVPR